PLITRPYPFSILFPYTTLFRSAVHRPHCLAAYCSSSSRVDRLRLLCRSTTAPPETRYSMPPRAKPAGRICLPLRSILQDRVSKRDRKSTRLNSSHQIISYAVFC